MSAIRHSAITEAAERYASALFELAGEAGAVAAVEADMKALAAAWRTSADLRAAMASPLYPVAEKQAALAGIAAKAGLHALSAKFVGLLAANGRAADLGGAALAFVERAARARGAVRAEVASAHALSDAQVRALTDALSAAFKAPVDVETSVRPDLLGGLVVKVGSKLFDDSVKAKLEALKIAMKGA